MSHLETRTLVESHDLNAVIEEFPLGPSRAESFEALDRAAQRDDLTWPASPVTSCPLPYLDLVFRHANGEPIRDTECVLDFPAGAQARKTTNASGRVHFADVDADASKLTATVEPLEPAVDGTPRFLLRVVEQEQGAQAAKSPAKETAKDVPLLYWVRPTASSDDAASEE